MNLYALLSWFDEDPAWLTACITSLAKANVDHLVAVDGPYLLYPNSTKRWRSTQQELQVIAATAYGLGIGLTLHIPTGPWPGNEVQKRNHMFDLARTTATSQHDWFLIIDSDETITEAHNLKQALAATAEDVAYYRLNEADGTPNLIRGLYRNRPDLHIRRTHYGYSHGDDLIWDGTSTPAANLQDNLVLEHKERDKITPRHTAKWEYYRARDEQQAERVPA